jgi:hypothetical protein
MTETQSTMSKPGPISAKPLSVLLSDVFSDAYARQGFAARELVTRWAEIAGREIAAHAEPLKIQWPRPVEGQPQEPATLVLRVDGPMALEIQHGSDVILQRVNRFLGWNAVGRLALRQAPLSRRTQRRWRKSPKPCPRSRTRICGPRWRGSAPRSSEIEPAATTGGHCHNCGFKLANSLATVSLGFYPWVFRA